MILTFSKILYYMKIVILDAFTLNPGDLSWQIIQSLGTTTIYQRTPTHLVVSRCQGAEIVLVNKVVLDADILTQLPNLQYIGVMATGTNNVDKEAAKKQDILICNIPNYGTEAVAQHTFALLLALTNKVYPHHESIQKGVWGQQKDFSYWQSPLISLAKKTFGIIGLGAIGKKVAILAQAFGMKVIAYHPRSEKQEYKGVTFVSLAELFQQSDVVSLHCSLNEENQELVNQYYINQMKPTTFLLNTSRGGLIQEDDLAAALRKGRIAGAALDVLSTEPPPNNHPLIGLANCLLTPHNAWAAQESRQRLLHILAQNIQAFLAGEPQHVVN